MPFYESNCADFPFHFSSLRPGFRAIRLAPWLIHRRIVIKRAADSHPIRASAHGRGRQRATVGIFRQPIPIQSACSCIAITSNTNGKHSLAQSRRVRGEGQRFLSSILAAIPMGIVPGNPS